MILDSLTEGELVSDHIFFHHLFVFNNWLWHHLLAEQFLLFFFSNLIDIYSSTWFCFHFLQKVLKVPFFNIFKTQNVDLGIQKETSSRHHWKLCKHWDKKKRRRWCIQILSSCTMNQNLYFHSEIVFKIETYFVV